MSLLFSSGGYDPTIRSEAYAQGVQPIPPAGPGGPARRRDRPFRPGGGDPPGAVRPQPSAGGPQGHPAPAVSAAAEGPHAADPHGRRRRVRRHQLPVPRALYRGADHPGGGAAERRPGRGPGEQGRGRHRPSTFGRSLRTT